MSGSHGAIYICRRCGKAGHFLNNCPTNSDPSYDKQPPQKLMNTSTGSRKIVHTLDGIDTKNKTVIYFIIHHILFHFFLLFIRFYKIHFRDGLVCMHYNCEYFTLINESLSLDSQLPNYSINMRKFCHTIKF